ncbi:MAG: hypothetical protein KKG59_02125 [Nanoarchaeota archaeon]|nr:hypothetical protein [Nanoarchaeota archaeon]
MEQETQNMYGKVILLKGDWSLVKRLCMSLSAKLQPVSDIMFIDTCNMFDILCLPLKEREYLLERIRIARPFSLKHLRNLISIVPNQPSKVLIISSLDAMFASKHPKDAAFVFQQMLSQLQHITKKNNIITIVGYEGLIPFKLVEKYVDCAYLV